SWGPGSTAGYRRPSLAGQTLPFPAASQDGQADRLSTVSPPPTGRPDPRPGLLGGRRPTRAVAGLDWTPPAGGPGSRTGERPNCFTCAPDGHCTSCATRPSPTPPRAAPPPP